jgi:hypothetical protein
LRRLQDLQSAPPLGRMRARGDLLAVVAPNTVIASGRRSARSAAAHSAAKAALLGASLRPGAESERRRCQRGRRSRRNTRRLPAASPPIEAVRRAVEERVGIG